MESEKMGIEQVKVMVGVILEGISVGKDALADGKIKLDDLPLLLKLIPMIQPAIDSAGQIPAELKDMDEKEAADLAAMVMMKLAIDDPKARLVIEKALKFAVASYELAKAVK